MKKGSKIWYRLRGILLVPFYLLPAFIFYGEIENDLLICSLGLPIFILGWYLRIWAQTHLHYRLKEKKRLTVTGPYRYVRNPIYIGNTLILAGATVLCELLWFVPIVITACLCTYHLTILYEEKYLSNKYGCEYENYMKIVPRWIPTLKNYQIRGSYPESRQFIIPSIFAESHIPLLLILPAVKELLDLALK